MHLVCNANRRLPIPRVLIIIILRDWRCNDEHEQGQQYDDQQQNSHDNLRYHRGTRKLDGGTTFGVHRSV